MIVHCPRAVPRDGLRNPAFEKMGPGEDLIVSMSFVPALTDRQMRLVQRWIRELEDPSRLGDRGVCAVDGAEPFIHENLFHARLGNLRDPRGEVQELVDGLTSAGVHIRDCFFACWEWQQDGVMRPRHDPRHAVSSHEMTTVGAYLDRLWDISATPPPSEYAEDLKGGFMSLDQLVLEHRGAPLFMPGVRLGYGLAPGVVRASDRRTADVRRTVVLALAEGWKTLFKAPGRSEARPRPLNAEGAVDQVDRIVCGTKVGYEFGIEAVELLDRPSPHHCRFREYELMEAVVDAVGRVGLAPVITWQRFGIPTVLSPVVQPDTVIVQVWEPGGSHTGHPALGLPWPIRLANLRRPGIRCM